MPHRLVLFGKCFRPSNHTLLHSRESPDLLSNIPIWQGSQDFHPTRHPSSMASAMDHDFKPTKRQPSNQSMSVPCGDGLAPCEAASWLWMSQTSQVIFLIVCEGCSSWAPSTSMEHRQWALLRSRCRTERLFFAPFEYFPTIAPQRAFSSRTPPVGCFFKRGQHSHGSYKEAASAPPLTAWHVNFETPSY